MNGFSRYLLSTLLLVLAGIASAEIETVTWLHTDHLGSPLMARDAQGNTLWQEDYSPWGERLAAPSANSADIGYTGHYEEADIGLTYAQARWYDPAVGRFLSADAVGFGAGGSGHFNRYTYAYDNPYGYIDPDGHIPVDTIWDIGSVIYDVGKIGVGYATGNSVLVTEGTIDLAADAAAVFIPYVPAGATKVAM
jgi:RHS repeat-associated protein